MFCFFLLSKCAIYSIYIRIIERNGKKKNKKKEPPKYHKRNENVLYHTWKFLGERKSFTKKKKIPFSKY